MLVLGMVGGAIAVVTLFTVSGLGRQGIILGLAVVGGIAVGSILRLAGSRTTRGAAPDRRTRQYRLAVGLYVVGIACFVASAILIALW